MTRPEAFEMLKCEECGHLKEPLRTASTICPECRLDSMHSVLICGRCEENETDDNGPLCGPCEAKDCPCTADAFCRRHR